MLVVPPSGRLLNVPLIGLLLVLLITFSTSAVVPPKSSLTLVGMFSVSTKLSTCL